MELRIPSEYQEVEYIENTGTQYIITNYVPKSDWTEVTWKAMFTVSQSGDSMLWGAWAGNATKKTWQCELYNHYNWYVACGAYRYGNITNMIIPIGEIFSGHIDNTLFTINNSSISPTETRNGENNMPLGIFCWNPNSGSKYINKGARIYELTFKENGIVSADFIPCYRKSDNEIGMYDTVSKTFYTNLGTGTFLKGSDVTRYIDNVSVVDTRRKIILNQPHIESASGDLVTFDTDMKGKLKECKVYFSPVQEGEGDPSPDNVRNITGWDGVNITQECVENITNEYSIDWTDSVGTIYGGYVDLVSGELVQTHYLAEITTTGLTSQNTNYDTTEDSIHFVIKNSFPQMLSNNSIGQDRTYSSGIGVLPIDCKVNYLKPDYTDNWRGTTYINTIVRAYLPPDFSVRIARDLIGVTSEDSKTTKAQKINNYLAEHPLQVYYKLETPIHYQLTPQQLTALRGTNTIYSNTNGQTEIKYWKH